MNNLIKRYADSLKEIFKLALEDSLSATALEEIKVEEVESEFSEEECRAYFVRKIEVREQGKRTGKKINFPRPNEKFKTIIVLPEDASDDFMKAFHGAVQDISNRFTIREGNHIKCCSRAEDFLDSVEYERGVPRGDRKWEPSVRIKAYMKNALSS